MSGQKSTSLYVVGTRNAEVEHRGADLGSVLDMSLVRVGEDQCCHGCSTV